MEKIVKLFLISELQISFTIFEIIFQDRKLLQFYKGNLLIFTGKFNCFYRKILWFFYKNSYFTVKTVNFPVKIGRFSRKKSPLFSKNCRKNWQPYQEKIFKSPFNNHIFKELRRQKSVKIQRASILAEVKMEKIDKFGKCRFSHTVTFAFLISMRSPGRTTQAQLPSFTFVALDSRRLWSRKVYRDIGNPGHFILINRKCGLLGWSALGSPKAWPSRHKGTTLVGIFEMSHYCIQKAISLKFFQN